MLSDRKKYSYVIGSDSSLRERDRSRYSNENSRVLSSSYYKEIPHKTSSQYQNKINQLQKMNRNLVEKTTRQFQQFEEDVAKVQNILEEKQKANILFQKQNKQLYEGKQLLIEALKQKDDLIRQLQNQIQQMLQQNQEKERIKERKNRMKKQSESQTSLTDFPTLVEKKVDQCKQKNFEDLQSKCDGLVINCESLNEQIDQLKGQLYSTKSQLSVLKEDQSTMKLFQVMQEAKNTK